MLLLLPMPLGIQEEAKTTCKGKQPRKLQEFYLGENPLNLVNKMVQPK